MISILRRVFLNSRTAINSVGKNEIATIMLSEGHLRIRWKKIAGLAGPDYSDPNVRNKIGWYIADFWFSGGQWYLVKWHGYDEEQWNQFKNKNSVHRDYSS